jgi:hypothetical protein
MLITALNTGSDSVFVDLLTYQDLEALRARKLGQKVRVHVDNIQSKPRLISHLALPGCV